MATIEKISDASIEAAAARLRAGGLVAFPTETVYGLGADATDDRAVAEIFAAKKRPDFNPLIVHVPNLEAARTLGDFDAASLSLARRFWPGALTLVVPRRKACAVSKLASAGLDTLALRVPAHPGAQKLLRETARPVAAPSANASGRLSPTEAGHVALSLPDADLLILDGGPCTVGLESTVVAANGDGVTILRPGGVTKEDIEAALGMSVGLAVTDDTAPRSPGMLASHYAPSRPLRMNASAPENGEAWLGFGAGPADADLNLSATGDTSEAAANLFAMLHTLDRPRFTGIAVSPIPEQGLGIAINDRLRRAAAQVIET